jgi:hypothetical protein
MVPVLSDGRADSARLERGPTGAREGFERADARRRRRSHESLIKPVEGPSANRSDPVRAQAPVAE